MHLTEQEEPFEKKKMFIEWQKQIKPLLTIDGKKLWRLKKKFCEKRAILGLLPILMRERLPQQREFSFIQVESIKLEKFMKEQRPWTGCLKSKSEALRLLLRPPVVSGLAITSIS